MKKKYFLIPFGCFLITVLICYFIFHNQSAELFTPAARVEKLSPRENYEKYVKGAIKLFEVGEFEKAKVQLDIFERMGEPLPQAEGAWDPSTEYEQVKVIIGCFVRMNGSSEKSWEEFDAAKNAVNQSLQEGSFETLKSYFSCAMAFHDNLEEYNWGDEYFGQLIGELSPELKKQIHVVKWEKSQPTLKLWQETEALNLIAFTLYGSGSDRIGKGQPCPLLTLGKFRGKISLIGIRNNINPVCEAIR